jgi:tetratricopeptide (TPR) repeat protein
MAGAYLGSSTDFYRSSDLTMTYTDYLQRRELDRDLAFQISEPIKELITVSEHALSAQISALEGIKAAQAEAAYEVVCAVRDLQEATEQGFRRVGSILEWGFTATLLQLGRISDQLSAIRNLLENPSLTWAYEQFNRARDLYRRGHYPEALESVDRAIHGHANDLGERTEHRFHQLRGVIRLGSFQNNSADVVNLAEAERDFLLASKYAAHDFPCQAADAQLCAAHAANHQGHYREAAAHAEKGLTFGATAGLHYELARSLLQLDRECEAKDHLQNSIRLDRNLLLKASGDPAFRTHPGFIEEAFAELLTELRALAAKAEQLVASEIDQISRVCYSSLMSGQTHRGNDRDYAAAAAARALRQLLRDVRESGGIIDIRDALGQVPALWQTLEGWNDAFLDRLREVAHEYCATRRAERGEPGAAPPEALIVSGPLFFGMAVAGLVFLQRASHIWYLLNHPNAGSVDDMLGALVGAVFSPIILGLLAWGAAALIGRTISSGMKANRSAAQSDLAALSTALSHELGRISQLKAYRPGGTILTSIPRWATGASDAAATSR